MLCSKSGWCAMALALLAAVPRPCAGSEPFLLWDLDQQPITPRADYLKHVFSLGDRVVFTGKTRALGEELWTSDGTAAGTEALTDLCPGSCSSSVEIVSVMGERFLFSSNLYSGRELWISDGTAPGTRYLTTTRAFFYVALGEIPGTPSVLLATPQDQVYFDPPQLWLTDGTEEGTHQVPDLEPRFFFDRTPTPAIALDDVLLFNAGQSGTGFELWRTDGTIEGTALVKDLMPGPGSSDPSYFVRLGDRAVFRALDEDGEELWISDGTAAGTHKIKDLTPGGGTEFFGIPRAKGDRLYFFAAAAGATPQLWVTDGTESGTKALTALTGTPELYSIGFLGDAILFSASDGVTGTELWRTDGTPLGATRVRDLCPGACSSGPALDLQEALGPGRLLFSAETPDLGRELWITDGTAAGTKLVADLCPGPCSNYPRRYFEMGGRVIVEGDSEPGFSNNSLQLWSTDGSEAGTERLTGAGDSVLSITGGVARIGERIVFIAHDPDHGTRLWRTDGTMASTVPVTGVATRKNWGSKPGEMTTVGDRVYFQAFTETLGSEIWSTDGTPGGTELLKEVVPGNESISPPPISDLVRAGHRLFFLADVGGAEDTNWQVWTSDGTAEGTTSLGAFGVPFTFKKPAPPVAIGDVILFDSPDDPNLWRSDGTSLGTYQLGELATTKAFLGDRLILMGLQPGAADFWATDGTRDGTEPLGILPELGLSKVRSVVGAGWRVFYFQAFRNDTGDELWVSDGTLRGTHLAADIVPGPDDAGMLSLVAVGNRVFFVTYFRETGEELWTSDGTPSGTHLVREIRPGKEGTLIYQLTPFRGRLYFVADDGVHGRELWVSDGTADGTALVADLWPGGYGSDPQNLRVVNGRLVFSAESPGRGQELWVSDGTPDGTVRVTDIAPGAASSVPGPAAGVGDLLVFAADDGVHGAEPWAIRLGEGGTPPPPVEGPPPPSGPWLTSTGLPGFRAKVLITPQVGASFLGSAVPVCIPETLCVAGALPDRSEVFVRVVGPKPNGYLWPTLVKFTTSEVEVWIEQLSTNAVKYYRLEGARPGSDELPGLFDREGFAP